LCAPAGFDEITLREVETWIATFRNRASRCRWKPKSRMWISASSKFDPGQSGSMECWNNQNKDEENRQWTVKSVTLRR
jgi:hypothetical protein